MSYPKPKVPSPPSPKIPPPPPSKKKQVEINVVPVEDSTGKIIPNKNKYQVCLFPPPSEVIREFDSVEEANGWIDANSNEYQLAGSLKPPG